MQAFLIKKEGAVYAVCPRAHNLLGTPLGGVGKEEDEEWKRRKRRRKSRRKRSCLRALLRPS